jgi:hypothetical protein
MTMLSYDAVRDRELLDIVDGLHRATITLADLETGTLPHLLRLKSAADAISAAINTISDLRLALHDKT